MRAAVRLRGFAKPRPSGYSGDADAMEVMEPGTMAWEEKGRQAAGPFPARVDVDAGAEAGLDGRRGTGTDGECKGEGARAF